MAVDTFEAGATTVLQIADFFHELKSRTQQLAERHGAASRGYFTPEEDDQARALLASYWQTRNALFELIADHKQRYSQLEKAPAEAFLIPLAAALTLVDAARFLRDLVEPQPIVRRKLNEPAVSFGIPGGTYDAIQKSLLSARNGWQLFLAHRYFEEHETSLRDAASTASLRKIVLLIDLHRRHLQVGTLQFATAKLRTRSNQILRRVGRNTVVTGLYGLQKFVSGMMSGVFVRPGHRPQLPPHIASQLESFLQPGDILLVRKQYALTNYFLPGYWPHVALYLGKPDEQQSLSFRSPSASTPNVILRGDSDHATATANTSSASDVRVLEALKDGVRLRGLASPFGSDSLVILRPRLAAEQIAQGLNRGLTHEGKPYDFDFDFARSDRLVCTEVVYRSYHGLGPINFQLRYRAGRPTLSGCDVVEHALQSDSFLQPIAGYVGDFSEQVLTGSDLQRVLVRGTCRGASEAN